MNFKSLIIIILVIFGLFFFGYDTDNIFVSFVLRTHSPDYFSNDLFVTQGNITFFFSIFSFITKFIDIKIIYFIFYVFCTFLNAVAIFNIAFLISKNKLVSYLTLFFMLGLKTGMSACLIGVNIGTFTPTAFVRPILLFSIYFFMNKNFRLSFLLTGLAFNIQGMESILVLTMFVVYFLFNLSSISKRLILESFTLLILSALPIILNLIFTTQFFEIVSADILKHWISIIRARSWYHIFPFSWGISDWFIFSGWILWAVYLKSKFDRTTNIFFSSILLLCTIGTVFVEIFPIPVIIKLHLWRSTIYFILFLIIYISRYLVESYNNSKNIIQSLIIAGTISSVFLDIPKLILPFVFLHIAYDNKNKKIIFIPLLIISLIGLLSYTFGSVFSIERPIYANLFYKILSHTNIGLKKSVVFLILFIFSFLFLKIRKLNYFYLIYTLIFLIFANSYLKDITRIPLEKDWIKVCRWARDNTSINSIFITPPYISGFRVYSQRSTFVEWHDDGSFAIFNIPYEIKWYERINNFKYDKWYVNPDSWYDLKKKYFDYSTEKFVFLAKKVKAKYIITENSQILELEKIYHNNHFCIYVL